MPSKSSAASPGASAYQLVSPPARNGWDSAGSVQLEVSTEVVAAVAVLAGAFAVIVAGFRGINAEVGERRAAGVHRAVGGVAGDINRVVRAQGRHPALAGMPVS